MTAIALLALLLALSAPAWAQRESEARTLQGTVSDKAGALIQNARVYLKNTKTLQVRTYITQGDGAFHFQGLAANTDFEVHAEHEGASSGVRTISSFDSRKQINISLKIEKK